MTANQVQAELRTVAMSDRARPAHDPAEDEVAPVGFWRLMISILWVGTISMGGRSASFLLDELVLRRRWLRREDWLEGLAISRVLPGPSGPSTAAFMVMRLRGWRAAALALGLYVLPGTLIALTLTFLVAGADRPSWVTGALRGLGVAAVAFFVYTISYGSGAAVRTARFGWILMGMAFVAYVLGADIVTVFILVGSLAVFVNRPSAAGRGNRAEEGS